MRSRFSMHLHTRVANNYLSSSELLYAEQVRFDDIHAAQLLRKTVFSVSSALQQSRHAEKLSALAL